jgi:hypothetical protein
MVRKVVLGLLGLALVVSFFLADSLGLTLGSYPTRYVVLVSGLGCILGALMGYRFGNFWKAVGIVLIGIVSLLVVVETISLYLMDALEEVETTLSLPTVRPPRPGLFKQEPYVGRMTKPGMTDEPTTNYMGFRRVPGAPPDSIDAIEVWLLGGDLAWGESLADDSTVAALLQARLDGSTSRAVRVRNMGQPGYVSTQELLLFMMMLRRNEYPEVVIRLDGYEEVFSAFCSGTAGDPIGYFGSAVQHEGQMPSGPTLKEMLASTATGRLYETILPREGDRASSTMEERSFYGGMNVPPEVLSESIVKIYLQNGRFFDELAGIYGIRHYCFWQPNVWCCQKPMSQQEEMLRDALPVDCGERGLRIFGDLLAMTDDALRSSCGERSNLYYLGDGWENVEEPIFACGWVLNPRGNDLISRRIVQVLGRRESWL